MYRPARSGEAAGSVPLTSVRGHFACVDEATEILSRRGWLAHHELRQGDEVAGYDLDTGTARWTHCHAVNRYDYNGPLVSVECRGLSMRLTGGHRTLAIRARRQTRGPEIVLAGNLRPKYAILRAIGSWVEDGREKSVGVDLARLCGWVAAEGHIRSDGRVGLCQSSVVNPEHCATIDALLARIDLPPADRSTRHRKVDHRYVRVARRVDRDGIIRWTLPLGLSQAVLALMPGKIPALSMVDLPLDETDAFLEAFINGDGHRRPDGRVVVTQKVRGALDVAQAMAVRLGWTAGLRHRPRRGSSAAWYLTLTRHSTAVLRRADGRSRIGTELYRGTVWCPETEAGTFVARRGGHVFVTGNSYGPAYGRGLLFGKYAGRFWWAAHARGRAGDGDEPVQRTYRLTP